MMDKDPRPDLAPRAPAHVNVSASRSYRAQALSTARKIGLLGDLHGDIGHALTAFETLARREAHVIVQLGDWGVLWPGRNWQIDLRKFSRALARHEQTLYFVDGNHDWHPKLSEYPIEESGIRWITENVGHLPRGYRTRIGGKFTLAAMGGANSGDRTHRLEGKSWWPEEQISETDLARLGFARADVLVGHEAPLPDEVAQTFRRYEASWTPKEATYAAASRHMFLRAVRQTHPSLTLGGHYHRWIDETVVTPGHVHCETRVVVLDESGKDRVNVAILDTATLEIEFMYRNGAPAPIPNDGSP